VQTTTHFHGNNLWGPLVLHNLHSYENIVRKHEKQLKKLSPEYWREVRLNEETELCLKNLKLPILQCGHD
jgi:hypothetical protein